MAFSLVAGFTATSTVNCQELVSTSLQIKTKYPFFTFDQAIYNTSTNPVIISGSSFNQHIISGQFFVAWGVLTMLYCIIAMVVYVLFTANENLEKVVDLLIYVVSFS